ncbi:Polysaccharide deacetylase [Rhizobium sp. RU35A]|uniref:polysaccharide deacetylase family protein n=1 Tax=Rhizobium sp. RU35A TaxID=1907414 RepID=UPI0009548239|nr:polysaccharide deacetylase family protein [Rhizobium sp. RU35A]SIQ85414.1 Polysaccharide deacetylase [Rhizobium sp. RU35A]
MSRALVQQHLDDLAGQGRRVDFWLRDDDAVRTTPALERLLSLAARHAVPLTLAVIPEETDEDLADRLAVEPDVTVAVHGWSHRSYSTPPAKKQELGLDRPLATVLDELAAGFRKLEALHGSRFQPMLVPPWNRIAAEIVEALPDLGFRSLSVFGREKPAALPLLNTHLDIMDWHGTYGGRPADSLYAELLEHLHARQALSAIGILTHHLVHDAAAWDFLEDLLALTARHPACRWRAAPDLLPG